MNLPVDVLRLGPEGDPGTDFPGKSDGTVKVKLSRVRPDVAADVVTSGAG